LRVALEVSVKYVCRIYRWKNTVYHYIMYIIIIIIIYLPTTYVYNVSSTCVRTNCCCCCCYRCCCVCVWSIIYSFLVKKKNNKPEKRTKCEHFTIEWLRYYYCSLTKRRTARACHITFGNNDSNVGRSIKKLI